MTSPRALPVERIVTGIALCSLAMWLGGLVAMGALAAPAVFRIVPAPWSGDAMTVAFRRFDRVALACAAILAVGEITLAGLRRRGTRADHLRLGSVLSMTALALASALFLSPRIEALHVGGAVRGLGPLGLELDRLHDWARRAGSTTILIGVALIFQYVWFVGRQDERAP